MTKTETLFDKMKVKTSEEKPCQVTLAVQLPADVVRAQEEKVSNQFRQHAQLPGFRAGKAPLGLVRQAFSEKIKNEALEQVLREAIPLVLKEKSLNPVSSPMVSKLEYNGEKNLSFQLIIERNPDFKAKSYTKIPVQKKTKKITEADVQKELEQLQERNAQLIPSKAEKAAKEHFAVTDYQGWANDKPVAALKAENQLINLSAPQSVEGIAEGILGLGRGETKDVTIQLPKEFPQKELAGKPVVLKLTLRDIKEKSVPALDDEFAKDFGMPTLAELKAKIEETMKKSVQKNADADVEKQIFDHLILENPIPVPGSLVEGQLEYMIERALSQVQGQIPKDKLEEAVAGLREKYKLQAERQVRLSYLIGAISKQEDLKAGVEDLRKEMESAVQANPDHQDKVKEYFDKNQAAILSQLTENKVLKFLTEHAKMKEIVE